MRTTAISNNLILILTTRGPMPSQFKFLPTNLNVQAGRNSVFLLKKVQSQALIKLVYAIICFRPPATFYITKHD